MKPNASTTRSRVRQIRLATILLLVFGPFSAAAQDQGATVGTDTSSGLMAVKPSVTCADLSAVDLTAVGGTGSRVLRAEEVTSKSGIKTCSVAGLLAPAINFSLVLPTDTWTGRYLQLGCGGLCGRVSLDMVGAASGCAPLAAGGFAIAATDMGHSGDDPNWGRGPQKRADFAHRAQHLTAVASKELIAAFYGQAPRFSYFNGCSDGGREALIEAERYPDDFDGIIAGAPALNFQVQNGIYHAWMWRANHDAGGQAILLANRLPLLHAAVLKACDGLDGQTDGLISYPPACRFDPATIQCPEGASDTANCLTAAEVEAARKLYDGPHDPATGERLTVGGPQFGSELRWTVFVPERPGDAVPSQSHALEHLTGPAFAEPPPAGFTLADLSFDRALFDRLAVLHPLYDATNPDLSAFEASGGKLILYHGWSDTDISPLNTLAYYEAVQDLMGEDKAEAFTRLYLFPGMYHCSQGEGPYEFDMLTPLMSWVERGQTPDAIVARQPAQAEGNGFGQFGPPGGRQPQGGQPATPATYPDIPSPSTSVTRSRPVFPNPATAAFSGQGDPNDAASYARGPALPAFMPPDWTGNGFFSRYQPMEQ